MNNPKAPCVGRLEIRLTDSCVAKLTKKIRK